MDADTAAEYNRLLRAGCEPLTYETMLARAKALGYVPDRSGIFRYRNNYNASGPYAALAMYWRDTKTGLSPFHVDGRRDTAFDAFQRMRRDVVTVHRGRIVEL